LDPEDLPLIFPESPNEIQKKSAEAAAVRLATRKKNCPTPKLPPNYPQMGRVWKKHAVEMVVSPGKTYHILYIYILV